MKQALLAVALFASLLIPGEWVGLSSAVAQTPKDKAKEKVAEKKAAAKTGLTIEVYTDNSGEFRFRIKDADDNNLAMASKGYKEKADAMKVVENLKTHLAKAKVEDLTGKASSKD